MTVAHDAPALLLEALHFASRHHAHQRRKDESASPYINHPIEVARLVAAVGGVTDVTVLAAALLHDVLEDTEATAEDLDRLFGTAVRELVVELTDEPDLSADEKTSRQIDRASRASKSARIVKLADKIANVRDVGHAPPSRWSARRRAEYLDGAERVVGALRGTNGPLERLFDETLREARAALARESPRPASPPAVRRMTLQDAAPVATLSGQLGYPASSGDLSGRLKGPAGGPDAAAFVAEGAGGEILGWVQVHGKHSLESDPCAEIGGLVVAETARGRGVGRALVRTAEEWARGRGYASVLVRSNQARSGSHGFYERLGYERFKTQHNYRRRLRDAPE